MKSAQTVDCHHSDLTIHYQRRLFNRQQQRQRQRPHRRHRCGHPRRRLIRLHRKWEWGWNRRLPVDLRRAGLQVIPHRDRQQVLVDRAG